MPEKLPLKVGYHIKDAERHLMQARDQCTHGSALWGLLETAIKQLRAAERCFEATREIGGARGL